MIYHTKHICTEIRGSRTPPQSKVRHPKRAPRRPGCSWAFLVPFGLLDGRTTCSDSWAGTCGEGKRGGKVFGVVYLPETNIAPENGWLEVSL